MSGAGLKTPLLSLVVLGFRNFELTTRPCLESLLPWLDDPDIELLVVDNGSPDDSAARTRTWCEQHPRARCLLSDSNRGFAGGMNWGAAQATGRWLLLVNNDTLFPAGALDALKRVVKNAPHDVAMLGPVTNSAGNGQRLWKLGAGQEEWLRIGQWLNENPTHELLPTYRCDFFCIAILRDVWEQLDGLDLSFGLGYYEDFDFSLRVCKAGYRQAITEDVFVFHEGSASFQGNKTARELIKRNKKVLKAKHPDARFEHARMTNLAVLQKYRQIKEEGRWNSELQARWLLRYGALEGDAPRSFFKRLIWRQRVYKVLSQNV